MTLQELRYVVALADTGHFGKAAEACFVSQSTLSTGLKKLEDFLGAPLFDRSLKVVEPTPLGCQVVESARAILEEAGRIRDLARHAQDPMDRTIQLGVFPTLGPYYLPHALNLLHPAFPKLRLLLREEMTPQIMDHLADGKLDAALVALPVGDPALDVAPLFREPFLAALPVGHILAGQDVVKIGDLAKAGLLLLEEGHCLRDQALDVCQLENLKSEEIRATSLETLRQMVGMGLGVTLLPQLACEGTNPTARPLVTRPLAKPGASRTIGLVWRKRSPVAETVARLSEVLARHLPPGTQAIR